MGGHEMTQAPLDRRDQTLAALFGLWMIVGLFLDGWAHDNQKPESFFTPWHGVLYSGFTAAALFAVHRALRDRATGEGWRDTPFLVAMGSRWRRSPRSVPRPSAISSGTSCSASRSASRRC